MSILFLWTCGGGGGGPTEPSQPTNPTVQNINVATNEDSPIAVDLVGSDPQNLALTFSIVEQPSNGTFSYSGSAGTYTPNANYNGTDTFTYVATNGTRTSNIATVSIVINPVDDNPNTMDVSATTDEDNAIDITLSAEEFDGDSIQFNVKDNPTNGTVSIGGPFNNQATYTPNADWYGTDTFTFEAVDVNGKKILNTATATITVNPINDGPQSNDVSATTDEDVEVAISLDASDVEGDSFNYSIVSDVSHGSTTLENGVVTYTSSTDWSGTDTFTYKANDGTDDGNSATATITVNNLPPLQGDLSQSSWDASTHSFNFLWNTVQENQPLPDKKYGLYESESSDMSSKTLIWEGNDTNFSWVIDDGITRYYTLGVRDVYGAESESNIRAMKSSNSRFFYDFYNNTYEEKTNRIVFNPNTNNLLSWGRAKDHGDDGSASNEYYILETSQDGSEVFRNSDDSYRAEAGFDYSRIVITDTDDYIILDSDNNLTSISNTGVLNWEINIRDQITSNTNVGCGDFVQTADGFVISCTKREWDNSTNERNHTVIIVKVDASGNLQYKSDFYNDTLGYNHGYKWLKIFQKGYDLNSDTFYIYGGTDRTNFQNKDKGFIAKITDTGSSFTVGTMANIDLDPGSNSGEYFIGIREHSSDSNTFSFYVHGTISGSISPYVSFYTEENDVYTKQWNIPFLDGVGVGGYGVGEMTSPNAPSDYVYVGQSIDNPSSSHGSNVHALKIDENGSILWESTINLQQWNGNTSSQDVILSTTYIEGGEFAGGVALGGYSWRVPGNQHKEGDAVVVIFDSNGASRTW